MAKRADAQDVLNPELKRDDLEPAAREPRDSARDESWGAWAQPDPLVQTRHEPVLSPEHLEPDRRAADGVRLTEPRLPDEGRWRNEASRDFRNDDGSTAQEELLRQGGSGGE